MQNALNEKSIEDLKNMRHVFAADTLGNLRNHVFRGDGNGSDRVGLGRVRRCSHHNTEVKQNKMSSWNV